MRNRNIVITVVAAVAAVAAVVALALVRPPGPATTADSPSVFRPLAGAGSATTDDVLGALSEGIVDMASYPPRPRGSVTTKAEGTNPRCELERPYTDELGTAALVAQQTAAAAAGAVPCLDFARSTVDTSGSADLAGAGLTFIPFAVDAVTFAQRADSANPASLTPDQLREIYTCAEPTRSGYLPLLPLPGSGLRARFLTAIGLTDSADFTATNSCVSEVDSDEQGENFGQELADPRHIAPYSVAQYLSQVNGVIPDAHGSTVLGQVGGVGPTRPNTTSSAVGVVHRADSLNGRLLTTEQLKVLYTCSASGTTQARYQPLLPQSGSAVRTAFLQAIGLTDAADFTTTHPCVSQTGADGAPLPENTGTALTDARQIVPYAIDQYLAQVNATIPDVHGSTVLGTVDGVAPTVPNPDFPFTHDVYNVVPTSKLDQPPTSTVFVGPNSAICAGTDTITKHGFAVAPNCGETTIHTPG